MEQKCEKYGKCKYKEKYYKFTHKSLQIATFLVQFPTTFVKVEVQKCVGKWSVATTNFGSLRHALQSGFV